ncbi:hypothetical protein D3C72_1827300 [compost metagenome]
MPLARHHFVVFGELEGHHVQRRAGSHLLLHHELVVALAVRGDDARGEVEQGQRGVLFLLAGQRIAHAELGAQLGRDLVGALDGLVAAGQHALARLVVLVLGFEDAVLHRPVHPHIGQGRAGSQAQGHECCHSKGNHVALLVCGGARL